MITSYEWDEAKNQGNLRKHGLAFDVVLEFGWSAAVIEEDERYNYGERRFRAFGRLNGVGVCVAFTPRTHAVRIITVRHMHEKETRRYGI